MENKKSGVELIAEERKRQIEEEGYNLAYDKKHGNGEMGMAAAAYAVPNSVLINPTVAEDDSTDIVYGSRFTSLWPWEARDWKPTPKDRIKELVKAGALIAAEIDRLQTTQPKEDARP